MRHDLRAERPATVPPPVKEYAARAAAARPAARPARPGRLRDRRAGRRAPRRRSRSTRRSSAACCSSAPAWCAPRSAEGSALLFRASGSAGARFPLEVYASTRGVAGVPDGVHWYDPVEHALVQVGPGGRRGRPRRWSSPACRGGRGGATPSAAGATSTGTAGTLLSQLSAAAASAGLAPRLRSLFPDAAVRGAGRRGRRARVPAGAADASATASRRSGPTGPATRGRAAAGRVPAVHARRSAPASGTSSGRRGRRPRRWRTSRRRDSLDEVVLRRGSQRLMDRSPTLAARTLLEWPMAAALRGVDVPHWVVVHGVDDVAPGRLPVARPGDAAARRRPARRAARGSAWTRRSRPTPRTSSSPPRRCRRSTTAATATPSSPPGWSRAGCTWRRTPWVRARPG